MGEKKEKKDTKGKNDKSKTEKNILKEKKKIESKDELKASSASPPVRTSDDRPIDVITYLTKLAVEHGSPANTYTKNRGAKDWERLVVQLASRIYERRSSAEEIVT